VLLLLLLLLCFVCEILQGQWVAFILEPSTFPPPTTSLSFTQVSLSLSPSLWVVFFSFFPFLFGISSIVINVFFSSFFYDLFFLLIS
jgi:hypothetical protein